MPRYLEMKGFFEICLYAALLFTSLWAIRTLRTRLFRAKLIRAHGCKPVPRYRHKEFVLGTDLYHRRMQALQDGDTFGLNRKLHHTYGKTFEVWDWGQRTIHTCDSANMQAALSANFQDFGVQPLRLHVSGSWLGPGIFTTDGPLWERSRALLKPLFARAQITDFEAFDTHLNRLFDLLPVDGTTVDLQPLFQHFVSSTFSPLVVPNWSNR